ncbi:RCC1/BLIP-II, partial [Trichodelitschia bisporula]
PGLYAWGLNAGRVADPTSDEKYIRTPRRIAAFDGAVLRDVKLDKRVGAAVDDAGDLLLWGTGFDPACRAPTKTLTGRDLCAVALSRGRVLALGRDGAVYSLPVSRAEQEAGPKVSGSFWSSGLLVSCTLIKPQNLSWGERVTSIASGLDHALLLTSKGRVFSAATSAASPPRHGQLGIPGMAHAMQTGCFELTTVKTPIAQIAAGDYHSVLLSRSGAVFTFGDNSLGQLGHDFAPESPTLDIPTPLPFSALYPLTVRPQVTSIAAGGSTSYFTVAATPLPPTGCSPRAAPTPSLETWASGHGLWGALGNGRFTHAQTPPVRIPALSGLSAWDEGASHPTPIGAQVCAGATHTAAVLETAQGGDFGRDVLFFGGNEFWQLGTGRRANAPVPVAIRPFEGEGERLQIAGARRVRVGNGMAMVEGRVECGRGVTAVYSG